MRNYDAIKNMSIEEMAKFLCLEMKDLPIYKSCDCEELNCSKCVVKYLKSEVTND